MSLQKLTWVQFNPKNLDDKTLRQLRKIYTDFVHHDLITQYIEKMLLSIEHHLSILLKVLKGYRRELFQLENFNVDERIEYFSHIQELISTEQYYDLDLQELLDLGAEIEEMFDESGLDVIIMSL